METGQKIVSIASRLYEARDTLRRLFGDQYLSKVQRWKHIIEVSVENWRCNALQVLPRLVSDLKAAGDPLTDIQVMWLMAATVEVVEPTEGSAG